MVISCAGMDRKDAINARLSELCAALVPYSSRLQTLDYGKISVQPGCLEYHLGMLRICMVHAMQKEVSLDTVSYFIEIMLLLVEKYEIEHENSGIVIQLADIRAKVPAEFQQTLEDGWKMVVGF
ncbi:hypothetical protein COT99_03915 [Candidatus Falkowbacteria bacterium CG10_big_fil_rev_8_21_14_0_10_43_10]|uniref:Uncharacterized protein n=1 Tax=Candidatus Falkowbacteria bacterium CG10_big_fil_rev_8_21_14_0_10_43_10 TaxID=1974567 RepID=A0A2H0V172_9BACT|nr:MAG: hypothetical protein COT99_03915 [Candidatus Falkowbacteria bacterium CG10_big_fil_rev_8_21_14_0_10_43_10]